MRIDIDFSEIERKVINEFAEHNKRVGKAVYPGDIVSIAARVAVVAIQKYHEEFHLSQQENQ